MIDYRFYLNGICDEKYQPKDLESLEVVADFAGDSIQPRITSKELTLVGDAASKVNEYIDGGVNGITRGIFEGIPYNIQLLSETPPYDLFKGYIDLLKIKRKCDEIETTLVSEDDLIKFSERCQATTFGFLQSVGYFQNSWLVGVPYVINYIPDSVQLIMTGISLFLMAKEMYETIPKLPQYIVDVVLAAIPAVGLGVTINIGNIVICVIKLILLIVYIVLVVIAIIKLIDLLIQEIYSIKRYHKGCYISVLLTQACSYLGYSFSSSIFASGSVFERLVFLPVKTKKGELSATITDDGVPNSLGYGYTVYEMFELAKTMFKAKICIKNNTVYLEPKVNLSFWQQFGTYILPDVEVLKNEYNTDELYPNYIIKFNYDIVDRNTIDNFTGTNYERITQPSAINNPKHLNFGGLQDVTINACLPTRKDSQSGFESVLEDIASVADSLISLFGANSSFISGFMNRVGSLNISEHFGWEQKLILLDSGLKLPSDHRTYLSAKYLYNNYHYIDSFVANNYGGQYKLYKDITIPFCFHDFLKTIECSYFTTIDGKSGKIEKFTWNFTQGYAKVDYRIQEPYTKNLQEIFIEA
jgi:hypothetical protein